MQVFVKCLEPLSNPLTEKGHQAFIAKLKVTNKQFPDKGDVHYHGNFLSANRQVHFSVTIRILKTSTKAYALNGSWHHPLHGEKEYHSDS